MKRVRLVLLGLLAFLGLLSTSVAADHRDTLPLMPVNDQPLATIGLRQPLPDHPGLGKEGRLSSAAQCDKDVDLTGSIAGVVSVAAQDNAICTSTDIDVYENGGAQYVVQAGGPEAAFTVTRIAADGTPTLVAQKIWVSSSTRQPLVTYTPDVKAFRQGVRRYIALSLERLQAPSAQTTCGVVIVDVTDVEDAGNPTPVVAHLFGSDWCDVHNSFVEPDASGDGRYLYLTSDLTNDLRVLDIGDLNDISEIGRYTHTEAGNNNYVHDITVIDHGGSVGRRVYVSYWDAGLMILQAADVTPGVIESGSTNQPLNPDHSIDPAGFLTHHAYPNADGTRVFIQDEFLSSLGDEPVQMWDTSDPANPSYVDGISLGSARMPAVNPAHNLEVRYDLDLDGDGSPDNRLYVGWYKAGLQAFDFDSSGFISRRLYHQVQTEAEDSVLDGAWGVRLAMIGTDTYVFQSDRHFGLIIDRVEPCEAQANPGRPDTDTDSVINACDDCPAWANADQSLPPWPVTLDGSDPDCDGWTTADENTIGTNPNLACGAGAWPPDTFEDQLVDSQDMVALLPGLFKSVGQEGYSARLDIFQPGSIIDSQDLVVILPFLFRACTS